MTVTTSTSTITVAQARALIELIRQEKIKNPDLHQGE